MNVANYENKMLTPGSGARVTKSQVAGALSKLQEYVREQTRARAHQDNLKDEALWLAVAEYLAGGSVNLKWQECGDVCGTCEDTRPAITITISPSITDAESLLSVFLHECGHAFDYLKRDVSIVPKSERESYARGWQAIWRDYVERNAWKHDRVGRSKLECQLYSLLDYPF